MRAIPIVSVVLAGLLVTVIAAQVFSVGLTYADGYREGKLAVRKDVNTDILVFFRAWKYDTVPKWRLERIRNKPETYQEGYVDGYREAAETTLLTSPTYWIGYTATMFTILVYIPYLLATSLLATL